MVEVNAQSLSSLRRLVDDVAALQSKLILLIGPVNSGKTALLRALAQSVGVPPLNLGLELGRLLAALPQKQRPLQAGAVLRNLADKFANGDLLLLDNIELLFDRSLKLDPLDLLKRHAHARRAVAVWPGELHDDRLTYAEMNHPEHQDYGLENVVLFDTQQ